MTPASASLEQARLLLDEGPEDSLRVARIRYCLELGRIQLLKRTPSQASPLFNQAWTLARASGEDFYAIDAAQMLATTEPQKVQKEWTQKGLQLAESSKDPRARRSKGSLYTTLGWMRFQMRDPDAALEYFEKALAEAREAGGAPRKVILARWAIARTYRSIGKLDAALQIQNELLAELQATGQKDGYVYEELAECHQALRKPELAEPYFKLAHEELSRNEWLKDNKPERIKRLKELGKVK